MAEELTTDWMQEDTVDNLVEEQLENRELTDHGRSLIAGLGMATLFGPLGLLAGGLAHVVQKKERDDYALLEASRLRGARNLINGTVEELDYLEQMSRVQELRGDVDEGFLFGDLQRLGLFRKRVAQAQAELYSGDPTRVANGQKMLDDVRLGVQAMLDDDDRLAEKFEERRFNIREDQRQFTRSKIQERLNVYENAQVQFDSAMAVATKAAQLDPDSAIGKAALWDFLAAPVQDATVPGVMGVTTAVGGVAGAVGGPVGAAVGTGVGAGLGTLLSGGFTDESNPNEYSMNELQQLAKAKMDALQRYTYGDGENPGIVDTYYNMAEEAHGFTRDEVNYPEDRTYNQFKEIAGGPNDPVNLAPRIAFDALQFAENDPEGARMYASQLQAELDNPPTTFEGDSLEVFIDVLENGERQVGNEDLQPWPTARAVIDVIRESQSRGEPARITQKDGFFQPKHIIEIYRDGQWQELDIRGMPFESQKLGQMLSEYKRNRRIQLKALRGYLGLETPDRTDIPEEYR